MNRPRTILLLAIGLGIGVWVFDAVVDAVFFYEQSFLALLVTDVPVHELYSRSLMLVAFVGFGVVAARLAETVQERERDRTLFRRLIDEATDSVYVMDPETGMITDVNETACEVLGYDRSTLVGTSVAAINPEFEDGDEFTAFLDSPTGRELEYYETRHVRADGTTFPVEISASDVTIDGRQFRIAIVRDITERKRRERRIAHYKQAVESSHDQLAAVDTELQYLFGNEAYRSFHGIETESVHGQSLDQLLTSEEFDQIEPHVREALAGDRVSFEIPRTHDSKDDRVLDVRYWPLRDEDGAIQGVGASLRDVTDHKEMIEDLRRARKRYESLFDSIRDAILVADTDRRIVDCNPAFSELFGYDLAEIEGEPTSIVYASDEEGESMDEALGQHMDDPTFVQTVRYEKQSGQVFPGETNVFYLRDREGEVTGFIGLIRDVSDRQARVTQIRTIDRVLRHNLSNALTVILGNAETIAEGETDDPRWSAERIIQTGEKLQATAAKEREITSFLAESRPVVECDAVGVVENAVADVRERYPDADLTVDLPATQPVLAVAHFDRAVEELLENALAHADTPEPSVTVTLEQIDDGVELSIADDGPGIPEMERAVLTGDHEIEPLFHGRGIGLWLVHLIVQYSDGQLSFAENDPRGSVVTVRLRTP
ncbi:two-component system sporulation sensor kinase A protein [Halorhabdus tiamatea SARL4B]|uniref:PAS/PAC sensor signal transduction histidine kinase n=1 Tax=Halorhabdus tiamatea SARL4B TaxID=1033806 RepID=F7PNR2_9EURY|nr:PAS domain S-box protein [Halorhabdus tiamatea]ERJ06779.1 two-component system sporulation sensor kinase A protein [Halorhabdus tiamatea SARL4B]CCQ33702.1 PAS/PAC sensor signal transduction histidine kinase [Halorhabdus tiamatea SARL4B]